MKTMTKTWANDIVTMNARIFGGMATMAMTMTLAACGDTGGNTASGGATDSGASSGASTGPASASVTEGSNSMSESASEATVGSNSDSQASMSTPTGSDSLSDSATVSASDSVSASASASDSTTGTTGAMTGTGDTDTAGTTVGVDTGSTSGDGSSSSTGGEPLVCGDAPAGFAGNEDPACIIEPKVGAFSPVLEWSKSTWSVAPTFNQVMAAPIVVSLTDDNNDGKINEFDVPDIVFTTFAGGAYLSPGWLRAVSGDDGEEILNIGDQNIVGTASVAAGDIDNDGIVEIVTVTTNGLVKAFEHDGTLKWTSPAVGVSTYSAAAIADMDGDGQPEIVVGKSILNSDGTLRATLKHGFGLIASVVADMNGDGKQEVVSGNAIYDADGKELWYNGNSDGLVGVGDINGDASPDIVVVSNGFVRLQNNLGTVLWNVAFPAASGAGGPPTIADFDGDGNPEIGVAGAYAYAVFKGNGDILWQKQTQDVSSKSTGSSVYDFEGDGAADVVYNDELRLRVYAGVNGAEKLNLAGHGSATLFEYPLVVDVDGDGQAEIVVINNNIAYGNKTGVSVYGDEDKSWRPGRKIWNQHAYSITNVNDDGTIPKNPIDNYKVHNNFRSGDLSPPDGKKTPDLTLQVPELCSFECVDNKLVLWVHVGNEGASPVTAGATVEVHGLVLGKDTTLAATALVDIIAPGQYLAALAYEIDPSDLASLTITVGTQEQECNLNNNEVVIQGPFCKM
jgi:hypothetical protein